MASQDRHSAETPGADAGRLVLRLSLGLLLLVHGVSKVLHGVGPVAGMVQGAGLPSFVAYGIYIGEVVAPLMLVLGLWTRLGALIVLVNMLFAFGLAHTAQLWTLGKTGGWALELQGFYLFIALAVMLLGAGRYSLGGRSGRFN